MDRHDAALGPLSQRAHDDFLVADLHVVPYVVQFREPRLVGRLSIQSLGQRALEAAVVGRDLALEFRWQFEEMRLPRWRWWGLFRRPGGVVAAHRALVPQVVVRAVAVVQRGGGGEPALGAGPAAHGGRPGFETCIIVPLSSV